MKIKFLFFILLISISFTGFCQSDFSSKDINNFFKEAQKKWKEHEKKIIYIIKIEDKKFGKNDIQKKPTNLEKVPKINSGKSLVDLNQLLKKYKTASKIKQSDAVVCKEESGFSPCSISQKKEIVIEASEITPTEIICETQNIFEAIDNDDIAELNCWLKKDNKSFFEKKETLLNETKSFFHTTLTYSLNNSKFKSFQKILKLQPNLANKPVLLNKQNFIYPMTIAIEKGNKEAIKLLKKAGADLSLATFENKNIFTSIYIYDSNKEDIFSVFSLFTENEINQQDLDGKTFFTRMITENYNQNIFNKFLENKKIDKSVLDIKHKNVAHFLIEEQVENLAHTISSLLNKHPKLLSQKDHNKETPLHYAIKNKSLNTCNWILKAIKESTFIKNKNENLLKIKNKNGKIARELAKDLGIESRITW